MEKNKKMSRPEILKDIIQYKKTNKRMATHFVLCKGSKIRYFIDLRGGKKDLLKNISSYSKKFRFLISVMDYLPFQVMRIVKLGYFVEAKFCDEVKNFINKTSKLDSLWNVIVGTYDEKQKLVVQLCEGDNSPALYYKIGNEATNKEMISEIDFLKSKLNKFKEFRIPEFISAQTMDEKYRFNIQVTKEFTGDKVEPVLNENIHKIFKELVESRGVETIDGIPYGFSHGDFAPWNMKKYNNSYTIFDWEHCSIRFYGFDLIHFVFQIESLLNGSDKSIGLKKAIEISKKFDSIIKDIDDNILAMNYVQEIEKIYGRKF